MALGDIFKKIFGNLGRNEHITQEDVGAVKTPDQIRAEGIPPPINLHRVDPQTQVTKETTFPVSTDLLIKGLKEEPINEASKFIRTSTRDKYVPPNLDSTEGKIS